MKKTNKSNWEKVGSVGVDPASFGLVILAIVSRRIVMNIPLKLGISFVINFLKMKRMEFVSGIIKWVMLVWE